LNQTKVKNSEVPKQMVSVCFAVALFVLLSKSNKKTLNKLRALRSDVMS